MQDIAGWGDIIFIVHTKDAIVEFEGPLPGGDMASTISRAATG